MPPLRADVRSLLPSCVTGGPAAAAVVALLRKRCAERLARLPLDADAGADDAFPSPTALAGRVVVIARRVLLNDAGVCVTDDDDDDDDALLASAIDDARGASPRAAVGGGGGGDDDDDDEKSKGDISDEAVDKNGASAQADGNRERTSARRRLPATRR